MSPYIRLVRYPYEEPFHLNLVMIASNGGVRGRSEFYVGASELISWADSMETLFCLRTDPAPINRLGQICRISANMKHEVLECLMSASTPSRCSAHRL